MKTASKSFLGPVVGGLHTYTTKKDKRYRTAANPITISKFGPSGSLKNANIALEHTTEVKAKINSAPFFICL